MYSNARPEFRPRLGAVGAQLGALRSWSGAILERRVKRCPTVNQRIWERKKVSISREIAMAVPACEEWHTACRGYGVRSETTLPVVSFTRSPESVSFHESLTEGIALPHSGRTRRDACALCLGSGQAGQERSSAKTSKISVEQHVGGRCEANGAPSLESCEGDRLPRIRAPLCNRLTRSRRACAVR